MTRVNMAADGVSNSNSVSLTSLRSTDSMASLSGCSLGWLCSKYLINSLANIL